MLKVRLQRVGRKNDPSFRVVVTDSKKGPKSGKYIEMLGSYNPRQKKVALNADRIKYWMSVGAQVTGTMHNLLIKEKITTGAKINVLPKKTPIKKEVEKDAVPERVKAEDGQKSEGEAKKEEENVPADEGGDGESDSSSERSEGEEKVGTPAPEIDSGGDKEASKETAK